MSDSRAPELPATPASDALPERIGPYRILRLLGRGGMGAVFEAEQENPRRTVALKVVSVGVLNEEMRRRFELEAQVLGHLHHPCIAQVYEAGMFESAGGSQPYFAMELIRGVPLSRYADQQELSTTERLELIARICDGIQHAHQRGVIHRDLKPDNILVDAEGQPKILDFGLARATDSDIQTSLMTDVGQIMGTVPYMSPEQALGDTTAIDARSDIYSLGVVAYELVSGRMPYTAEGIPILEALRVVREEDAEPLGSVNTRLRGDIDTIIGKALEKERERRYPAASALAEDIRRHLEDRPILARPPSAAYQLRKFARRNRGLVIGVAAVFVALVVGLIGTARGFIAAEADAQRAQSTVAFFEAILGGIDPAVAQGADTTLFKDILDDTAGRINVELEGRPLVAASIHRTMASAYHSIAEYESSVEHGQRAYELFSNEGGADSADAIGSMNYITMSLARQGRFAEGLELALANLERAEGALGPDHPTTLHCRAEAGVAYLKLKRDDEAATYFEPLVAYHRSHSDGDAEQALTALNCLGLARLGQGRFGEAAELLEEVLAERERISGEQHPETITAINNLAGLHLSQARLVEAEAMFRDSLARSIKVRGPSHELSLEAMQNLAFTLSKLSRGEEALELSAQIYEARLAMYGPTDGRSLASERSLAEQLRQLGRDEEAKPHARAAYEGLLAQVGPEDPRTLLAQQTLASTLNGLGDPAGEQLYVELVETSTRVRGEDDEATLLAASDLGWLYFRADRPAEAEPYLRRALEGRKRTLGDSNPDAVMSRALLGKLLHDGGRPNEAIPLHGEFLVLWAAIHGDEHPGMAAIAERFATDLERTDEHGPHEPAIRALVEYLQRTQPADSPALASAQVYWTKARFESGDEAGAREVLEEWAQRYAGRESELPERWSDVVELVRGPARAE